MGMLLGMHILVCVDLDYIMNIKEIFYNWRYSTRELKY